MPLASPLLGCLISLMLLTGGSWPLVPRPEVVRGFDPPVTPWGSGHRGVDLLGHPGQGVHAARSGRISFAGRLAGRGVVVVDHGITRTTYEPVRASVHVGDGVAQGQVIGTLQLHGSHCLPRACLHWGWIQGRRTYLDPLLLVGGGPVRLLPPHGPLGGTPVGSAVTRPWVGIPTGGSAAAGAAAAAWAGAP